MSEQSDTSGSDGTLGLFTKEDASMFHVIKFSYRFINRVCGYFYFEANCYIYNVC